MIAGFKLRPGNDRTMENQMKTAMESYAATGLHVCFTGFKLKGVAV